MLIRRTLPIRHLVQGRRSNQTAHLHSGLIQLCPTSIIIRNHGHHRDLFNSQTGILHIVK